jgi:hypothetical protein
MSIVVRNGFSRLIKLRNTLGVNNHLIPKYENFEAHVSQPINTDVFLFPSYLPNTYNLTLNKKNESNSEDIIHIKYIKKIEY